MQQIQKLELIGFKSFCDRTQVAFDEGITAIVGPNGCGKSNLADAISWVVGEQSAKSLRTDRMEGVIFNGTQARKATSLAEVILTLRLSASFTVPEGLELDPEGFTVGRTLYRSGESEYYLDGRRCRLRDILQLFEGTGLGPNSYALIEQGRIGQILSSKPAERRALIEEAARITLFKSRRHAAETKLELAQQNLLRVDDIIREITRQLNSLRRQAAKARRYARLREEQRSVHKLKLGMEQRDLREKLDSCRQRFATAVEREQAILSELSRAEERRAEAQDSCLQREELVNQIRDRLAGLKIDAERANNLREHQQSQKGELERKAQELDLESRSIEERGELVDKERKRLEQTLQSLLEEIAREQQVLEAEQARSEELERSVKSTEAEIDGVRSFLLDGAGKLSDHRNLVVRCQDNLRRIEAQAGRLQEERDGKNQERATLLAQLAKLQQKSATNTARREEISTLQADSEKRASDLDRRMTQISADLTALQEEYSLMQHRYSSLEEVERRRSNYSEGVQKFLSAQLPGEEVHPTQTLADHVETDACYEGAVEDYLNEPLQYILVDGLQEAVQGVERLKRIRAGKCTFLTLRNGHTNGSDVPRPRLAGTGIIGYLDELLRMREDVKHAFERALPELASTVMVTDLETAFRVAETRRGTHFLTLNGEAYSPRGILSAVGERKSMAGFLALKREKRDLEVKLVSLRGKIQTGREELAHIKEAQTTLEHSLKSLADESRRCEIEGVGIEHEVAGLESEIRKIDQTESVASLELSQLLSEKQDLESSMKEAQAGIAEIEETSRSGEDRLRELNLRLESLRTENASTTKALAGLLSSRAVRQERRSSVESELRRLSSEGNEVRKRAEANRVEREGTLARGRSLTLAQQETEAQIQHLAQSIQKTEQTLAESQKELARTRESLASVEERLRQLHGERELAMENRGKVEIEKTRLESDLEHLERACQDEFHATLSEILAQIPNTDWQREYAEVSDVYNQLRERVENFGAINMRALEEYQELDQRFQFLSTQHADIQQSILDTQKAIAEMNRRSIEKFQDAFARIRENFMDVFQILFKGGQCDLRLLDEGDLLESGIDIIAQPPGKRLQNVLLLSGGEKALTALALLIAIFRYRPSPFCVLDEVDAPLDDANITRFTQLITELSKETQFVLITHNKRTMEIAQTLYGVTMEEPGVSKIVSVDFRATQEAMAR